jgi:microcystin-dependent protein
MPVESSSYVGEIFIVPFNFAPVGTITCAGQVMAISQNTALFSLLGTTFGGNGTSNFNLPDLQGRMVIGAGNGAGLSPRTLGQIGGEENVTLLTTQIPSHNHPLLAAATPANAQTPVAGALAEPRDNGYASATPTAAMAPASIGASGGSQPHDNMPPFLGLQFVISLFGVFPPRN